MRAIIRHSPIRVSPGSNCWPPANCPMATAGRRWWPGDKQNLAADVTNTVPTPSTKTALLILGGAIALAVWARWE